MRGLGGRNRIHRPALREELLDVSIQARSLQHPAAALAAAAPKDRADPDPGRSQVGQLRPRMLRIADVVLQDMHAATLVPEIGRGAPGSSREALRGLRGLPPVLERQLEGGQDARYKPGGEYLDGIRFTYEGGQIRSLLSLLSYFGKGEMRERALGIKIPPTNLKPDFNDPAHAFANELADRLGQSQQLGESSSSHANDG